MAISRVWKRERVDRAATTAFRTNHTELLDSQIYACVTLTKIKNKLGKWSNYPFPYYEKRFGEKSQLKIPFHREINFFFLLQNSQVQQGNRRLNPPRTVFGNSEGLGFPQIW